MSDKQMNVDQYVTAHVYVDLKRGKISCHMSDRLMNVDLFVLAHFLVDLKHLLYGTSSTSFVTYLKAK